MSGPRPARSRRWFVTATSLVIILCVAGDLAAQTGRSITVSDFSYLGAFRLDCSDDWCAYNLDGMGMAADGSLWVFPVGDKSMHPEAASDAVRRLADQAGLPGVRLHDLRHTAATLALAAGVPVRDVSDALGHSSPSVTLNVYGHAIPEGPSRVADALDKALGGES